MILSWLIKLLGKATLHETDYKTVELIANKFLNNPTIKVKTQDYGYVLPNRKQIIKFMEWHKNNRKYISNKRDCDDFVRILLGQISEEGKGWTVAGISVQINAKGDLHKLILFIDDELKSGYIDAELGRIVNAKNCYVPINNQVIEF